MVKPLAIPDGCIDSIVIILLSTLISYASFFKNSSGTIDRKIAGLFDNFEFCLSSKPSLFFAKFFKSSTSLFNCCTIEKRSSTTTTTELLSKKKPESIEKFSGFGIISQLATAGFITVCSSLLVFMSEQQLKQRINRKINTILPFQIILSFHHFIISTIF